MAGLEVKKMDKEQHTVKLATHKSDLQCANIATRMCPHERGKYLLENNLFSVCFCWTKRSIYFLSVSPHFPNRGWAETNLRYCERPGVIALGQPCGQEPILLAWQAQPQPNSENASGGRRAAVWRVNDLTAQGAGLRVQIWKTEKGNSSRFSRQIITGLFRTRLQLW